MLFIHDVHAVIGEREFDFEDSVRDDYAAAVAKDDARLLWYLHAVHGAGEAYRIVTITAVRDGATWERLVERSTRGDIADWREKVDAMRYGSTSTLLVSAPWSPLHDVDLDAITAPTATDRDTVVFREDTLTGAGLDEALRGRPTAASDDVLELVAAFQPALKPSGEVQLLYRIPSEERWTNVLGIDHEWNDWTGSLTPQVPAEVQATSRIMRTTRWSPLT